MKNIFKRKPKEEKIPEIEQSDMYKAFRYLASIMDEVIEEIAHDDVKTIPKPEISYSQAAQAIRIADKDNNCVVTMKFNCWDKEHKDFVDKCYYRPYDAPSGVGNGGLMSVGIYDSTIAESTGYITALNLPYDERTIIGDYCDFLHIHRIDEECGIVNLHKDKWLVMGTPCTDKE